MFTVRLVGFGNTPDEVWDDAVGATDLDSDPTPDEEDYVELENDEEDEDDEEQLIQFAQRFNTPHRPSTVGGFFCSMT